MTKEQILIEAQQRGAFEHRALAIMCAIITADKDIPMNHAAEFGIEGARELETKLADLYNREHGRNRNIPQEGKNQNES